jgi:Amt family ammonium transporter
MLISTALVLLMTPALAFFYGGLVRSKNALNTMMMSFVSLGFVGVRGRSSATRWRSRRQRLDRRPVAFLRGVGLEPQGTIPHCSSCASRARSRSSRPR